ncbi:MAG: hypothetical protein ACLUGA_09760 [Oscillospiraceae bacterium]
MNIAQQFSTGLSSFSDFSTGFSTAPDHGGAVAAGFVFVFDFDFVFVCVVVFVFVLASTAYVRMRVHTGG